MKRQQVYELNSFKKRVIAENAINAIFLNIIISAVLMIVSSIIVFFIDSKFFYVPLIVFLLALGLGTTITLFARWPSILDVAHRIDESGFNQQVTTMVEFLGDDSEIAMMQRERVKRLLSEHSSKEVKIKINKKFLISAIVVLAVSFIPIGFVGASNFKGVPQYHEIQKKRMTKRAERKIIYSAEEGGRIIGKLEQEITDTGKPVYAIPNDGYYFVGWSDGNSNQYRIDSNISGTITLKALFRKFKHDQNVEGISDKNLPQQEYEEHVFQGDKPSHIGGGSGKYEEINQIIDGKTYYRDVLEKYTNQELQALANDKSIPEEIRRLIEEYFKIIK